MTATMLKNTIFLLLIFMTGWYTNASPASDSNSFILKDVHIVDVEHKLIHRGKNVLVKNGIIEAIFDNHEKTKFEGIESYQGNGGYLTPGLIDMHVHIYEPAAYLMTLSHGVTHVRIMNGVPKQLEWRDKIASGEMLGSSSTVSSPIISAYKDAYLHHYVENKEEAKQAVTQYHQQGYDLIKAYGNLSEESLSAVVTEAKKINFPVAKHGPHASGKMPLSHLAGLQSFEHMEDIYQGPLNHQFSYERLNNIADEIKYSKVPVTPTLNIFYQLTEISEKKDQYLEQLPTHYTPTIITLETKNNQVKRWLTSPQQMVEHNKRTMDFLLHTTKVFDQRGVTLLVGSDSGVLLSPHGIATHTEMKLMQQAGVATFEVLRAATINAAKALNLDNKIGKIAPTLKADFILTTTNPITDLSVLKNPSAVIKNGHWYSSQVLNDLRDKAISDRSFWQELTTLLEAL